MLLIMVKGLLESSSVCNQNYYKILERDWLSAAWFEHLLYIVVTICLLIG